MIESKQICTFRYKLMELINNVNNDEAKFAVNLTMAEDLAAKFAEHEITPNIIPNPPKFKLNVCFFFYLL